MFRTNDSFSRKPQKKRIGPQLAVFHLIGISFNGLSWSGSSRGLPHLSLMVQLLYLSFADNKPRFIMSERPHQDHRNKEQRQNKI